MNPEYCQSKTQKNIQCSRRPKKGSKYCGQHEKSIQNNPMRVEAPKNIEKIRYMLTEDLLKENKEKKVEPNLLLTLPRELVYELGLYIGFREIIIICNLYNISLTQNYKFWRDKAFYNEKIPNNKFDILCSESAQKEIYLKYLDKVLLNNHRSFSQIGRYGHFGIIFDKIRHLYSDCLIQRNGVVYFDGISAQHTLGLALSGATSVGDFDLIKKLVAVKATIDEHVLVEAAEFGNLEIFIYLFFRVKISKFKNGVSWIIQSAARQGNLSIIKFLMDKGPGDINLLLRESVLSNNMDLVKYLISRGATDFNLAIRVSDDIDMIKFLISKGAIDFELVLNRALTKDDLNLAKFLIEKGAKITPNTLWHIRSLRMAQYLSSVVKFDKEMIESLDISEMIEDILNDTYKPDTIDLIKFLITLKGLDKCKINNLFQTSLGEGHIEVADYFKSLGANEIGGVISNIFDKDDLEINVQEKIIKYILNLGLDIDIEDINEVLFVSISEDNTPRIDLLLKYFYDYVDHTSMLEEHNYRDYGEEDDMPEGLCHYIDEINKRKE